MAEISFTFDNTESDQHFKVSDTFDGTVKWEGNLNNGDTSPPINCWADGNGLGHIQIAGAVSGITAFDVSDGGKVHY